MDGDNDQQGSEWTSNIASFRAELQKLHDEKETLFAKREKVSLRIRSLIASIKGQKSERNILTDSVKLAKEERDRLNALIREKITELKKLRAAMPPRPASNAGGRERKDNSPGFMRKQIDEMEQKIEHGLVSFEKEKELMKKIKDFKKKLEGARSAQGGWERIRALSKEVDELKKQADAHHKVIQDAAKDSQQKHEEVLTVSKEIDELKIEEKKLHEEFLAKKAEYMALADKVKGIVGAVPEERKEKAKEKKKHRESDEAAVKRSLARRREEVETKLSKGEKLTTEDLLILQSGE
ncbi:hypothetical protein HY641_01670 [Candidatus Woesearchaeota archaeon]|nr:hypothetical protein [Candidatus Woesearchaeota archaeon]